MGTLLEDTFDNRRVCGEGDFDVAGFINAVRDLGWTGPWGVEDMSTEFRALPVREALRRARDGVLAMLRRGRPAGGVVEILTWRGRPLGSYRPAEPRVRRVIISASPGFCTRSTS